MAIGGGGGSDGMLAARGACNVLVAGASGGITALVLCTVKSRSVDDHTAYMLYGIAAGSISMSGCPTSVEVYEAFWIGLIGGALYSLFTKVVTHKLGIDDPLEGTSYHFICGLWGTMCTGFFEERNGIFHEGDGTLFGL
jgi:Amt family ammonium transporter